MSLLAALAISSTHRERAPSIMLIVEAPNITGRIQSVDNISVFTVGCDCDLNELRRRRRWLH
jgi:hypothetical protein